jgi:hypothetical protein
MASMTQVTITGTSIEVRFTTMEKIAGLMRNQEVDRRHIAAVTVASDGVAAARGIRAPGLGVPGLRKIGTWRQKGARTLVSVRRGQPALSLHLTDGPYAHMLLGTADAQLLADELAPAATGSPTDSL